MFCVFSVFCGNSLPVCLVENVVVSSHGIHGIHGMLGCVIGGVGMAGMPYPPNLCASVSICGRLSLPECSVCSVYSVGHSLCLLCWCCRGSCTSVVVFSHGIHGFPQMVRLRYWRRGYGRMPYPPNLCVSVPICGRYFSARRFCVFRVFCGNTLPVCLVMSVVVFSHGFHGFPQMVRLRYWRRGYGRDAIPS